ncbi:hypothetical protein RKE29_29555, partial [Streptomyces sp. B1866]|nr:hypothetical protein [Streptomyces sp. B1866]
GQARARAAERVPAAERVRAPSGTAAAPGGGRPAGGGSADGRSADGHTSDGCRRLTEAVAAPARRRPG